MNKRHYPRYRYDFFIRLLFAGVGSFVVTQYGGSQTILELLLMRSFYIEFIVTLAFALLILQIIYMATRLLDRKFDWHQRLIWRIPLQVVFGILLPTLVNFLLAAAYFAYYDRNILSTNYQIYALPYIIQLLTMVNVYYYIRYLLEKGGYFHGIQLSPVPAHVAGHRQKSITAYQSPGPDGIFIVKTSSRSFPVPYKDIAYFFRSDMAVYLRTANGQDHILAQSLDSIEGELSKEQFFRVSRRMIVNLDAVEHFSKIDDGKLALTLNPPFEPEVTVSRLLAKRFTSWLQRQVI